MEVELPRRHPRSAPIRVLNQHAETHSFTVNDVDWSTGINHKVPWMPSNILPLRFLPSFGRLTYTERLRLNQMYAVYIAEQFIWFEQELICPILMRVLATQKLDSDFKQLLNNFVAEELRHSELFRRLLCEVDQSRYAHNDRHVLAVPKSADWLFASMAKYPLKVMAWIWLAIYFEEKTIFISKSYRDGEAHVDPIFKRCHELHMIDEARHLQIDQYLLQYFYDKQGPLVRKTSAFMLRQVLKSYARPRRGATRLLNFLSQEFPKNVAVHDLLRKELYNLRYNQEFKTTFFGDEAMGRTRTLLSLYPENKKALSLLS